MWKGVTESELWQQRLTLLSWLFSLVPYNSYTQSYLKCLVCMFIIFFVPCVEHNSHTLERGERWERANRGNNAVDAKKLHNTKGKQNKFTKVEDHNKLLNIHLHTDIPGSDSPWAANWWRLGEHSGMYHCVHALFLPSSLGSIFGHSLRQDTGLTGFI